MESLYNQVKGFPFRIYGPKCLFLVDEAQELKTAILESLRGLWDRGDMARLGESNQPAFGLALVGNDTFMGRNGGTPSFMARLADLLKLDKGASEDDILQALEAMLSKGDKPDPEKYVPIDAVRDMMRDRKATATAASRDRAEVKVEKALAEGHIIPAMKGWALDLCMTNEASFDSFVSDNAPAAYAHLHKPTHASVCHRAPALNAGTRLKQRQSATSSAWTRQRSATDDRQDVEGHSCLSGCKVSPPCSPRSPEPSLVRSGACSIATCPMKAIE